MNRLFIFLNALMIGLQVILCIFAAIHDEILPIHWNIAGEIDAYGPAWCIFIIPGVSFLSWCLISYLKSQERFINIPDNVNDPRKALRIAKELLDYVVLWISAFSLYLVLCVSTGRISPTIMIASFILLFAIIIIKSIKISKA